MKPGDLYRIGTRNYMVLEVFDRRWTVADDQGAVSSERYVVHVSCVGPTGMEEFPMGWFSKKAEPIG
jgi:hypothetical protein